MKKYAAMLAAGLIAILGLTALAPSAEAYPVPSMTLTLNLSQVVAGHKFVANVTTDAKCTTLSLSFNGTKVTQKGSHFVHTFNAPSVKKNTEKTVVAVCTYTAVSGTSGHALRVGQQTLTRSAKILIVPVGGGNGGLPDTGGPSVGWLIAGIAALLAGAGAMFAGRRRGAGAVTH